jgi:hypothetical protein
MGKRKLDVLTVPPPADPAAVPTGDGNEYGSPTQSGPRTPTNNVARVTLEELLKTPTKKPDPNPDIMSTPHVAKVIGRVPFRHKTDDLNAEEFQVMLFHDTFLDTFLPWQGEPVNIPQNAPHFPVYTKGWEKLMYAPFVSRPLIPFLWPQLIFIAARSDATNRSRGHILRRHSRVS